MEGNCFKLDVIAPTMNGFIEKLQMFNALEQKEKKTCMRSILMEIENLKNSLESSYAPRDGESRTLVDNQIDRIFSEFNWNVNYKTKPNEFSRFLMHCKSLAGAIMKILGTRNCRVLIVEMYFRMCIKLVGQLTTNVREHHDISNDMMLFQLMLKSFLTGVRVLKNYWYVVVLPGQKCSIMLCLNQSFKTLTFLGKVIDRRLSHLVEYLLNRLRECFDKILDLLYSSEEECSSSEFIILMDSCLNKLDRLSRNATLQDNSCETMQKALSSLKVSVDELLCHAMTVSHITSSESDRNLIKSYSQKVLDGFQQMSVPVEEGSECDFSSRADALGDTLCQLEEIVNVSILNVVLDVFVDINDPLRNLLNRSKCDATANKSANDLENEISLFDEHMDRIMHIGLFAVSCSTDVKRILEIRSCLASLESLEAELITSIVANHVRATTETNATFQFLFRNWLEEITELKNLMDLIVDPGAFCRVVEKRIAALSYEMKENESASTSDVRFRLGKILRYAKKLIKTLLKSVELDDDDDDDGEQNRASKTKGLIESLQLAYQECEASASLLQPERDRPVGEVASRIAKRSQLVVTAINNLASHLLNSSASSDGIGDKDAEGLFSFANDSVGDNQILTPYINKGKLRLKEMTVLYNTPKNNQHFRGTPVRNKELLLEEMKTWRESFRSHFRTRCCRSLSRSVELENSLDLELSNLLDNVTELSETFESARQDCCDADADKGDGFDSDSENVGGEADDVADAFVGARMRRKMDESLKDLSTNSTLSILKDSSNCQYRTPERLNDLSTVQQKIDFLMEHLRD